MEPMVSYFSSTKSKIGSFLPLSSALSAIRDGKQRDKITRMREIYDTDHDEYNRIKGTLPANLFAGKFVGGHAKNNLSEYNCFLTLDIDKLSPEDVVRVRSCLVNDDFVYSFWLSPSGRGFKGLVLLDFGDVEVKDFDYWHKLAYHQLLNYFKEEYDIELDISCSDISRLCYVSYDQDLCVKDNIVPYLVQPIEEVKKAEIESKKYKKVYRNYVGTNYRRNEPGRNKTSDRKVMSSIIKYLEKNKISITSSYYEWFSVAMAIVTEFNYDIGKQYFLRICSLDGAKHDENGSISLLKYCYEHSNHEITLGTLIYFAQRKGYRMIRKAVPTDGYQIERNAQ